MPVYEYECKSCEQRIEKIQKLSDSPLTQCEACGGVLRKVFSPSALVFKGSGFYITDYKNKKEEDKKDSKTETPKTEKSAVEKTEKKTTPEKTTTTTTSDKKTSKNSS